VGNAELKDFAGLRAEKNGLRGAQACQTLPEKDRQSRKVAVGCVLSCN
jgi:hypothetical protein